jgi:hypothetical protein
MDSLRAGKHLASVVLLRWNSFHPRLKLIAGLRERKIFFSMKRTAALRTIGYTSVSAQSNTLRHIMLSSNLRACLFAGAAIFVGSFTYGLVTSLHKPADPAHIRSIISTSAQTGCVKTLHNDPRVSKLKDSTINSYCSCAIDKAVAQYTDAELLERDRQGPKMSPEDTARFTEASKQCFDVLAQK